MCTTYFRRENFDLRSKQDFLACISLVLFSCLLHTPPVVECLPKLLGFPQHKEMEEFFLIPISPVIITSINSSYLIEVVTFQSFEDLTWTASKTLPTNECFVLQQELCNSLFVHDCIPICTSCTMFELDWAKCLENRTVSFVKQILKVFTVASKNKPTYRTLLNQTQCTIKYGKIRCVSSCQCV